MISRPFIQKYRSQYYSQKISVADLQHEQAELMSLLNQLHEKTNKEIDKKVVQKSVQKKKLLKSRTQRNTKDKAIDQKQNRIPLQKVEQFKINLQKNDQNRLPSITVADAKIRNCLSYSRVLKKQKIKLDMRMQEHNRRKKYDINQQINQGNRKIKQIVNENKTMSLQIGKNGQQIVSDPKNYKALYQQLLIYIKDKKAEIKHKNQKIQDNQMKTYSLEQQIQQVSELYNQVKEKITLKTDSSLENSMKETDRFRVQRYQKLNQKKQKYQISLQSLNLRLSQEYYCKLKQLENEKGKMDKLNKQYVEICQKVMNKQKQLLEAENYR